MSADGMFGFRRVERVHLRTTATGMRAEVTGVVHRLPRTVVVPLRVATKLVLAGAPLVIDDLSAAEV